MGSGHKFSLDNFKKWMNENHEDGIHQMDKPVNSMVGKTVLSKVSVSKLVSTMESDSNNLEEMAIEFRESGGTVVETEGKELTIEVSSGCFKLPRNMARRYQD